jgi:hypothetical protein
MTRIRPEQTPALEAYLIALICRDTRAGCLSPAALTEATSHDRLSRLPHSDVSIDNFLA